MRLQEALEETATGALRRMASVHGLLYDDSTTRAELIERIAERLADPIYLQEQLGSLSDDERAALFAARASGGEQRGFLLERDHPGAAEALVERGLLFRLFAAAGPRRGELFTAPDELLGLLPEPPAAEAPPIGEPAPSSVERRASDPAFSLFCIASALRRHRDSGTDRSAAAASDVFPRVPGGKERNAAGGSDVFPSAPSGKDRSAEGGSAVFTRSPEADRGRSSLEHEVRPWSEEPGGWAWDARWLFLRHLAQAGGLLVHQADGALVPGPTLGRLLDDPSAAADRLRRTYLRDRGWSELVQTGFGDGEEVADTVQLRRAIVEVVQALPAGAWIGFDALSDWLRRTRPTLVREQLNARGLVLLEPLDWASFEQRLLRYVVLGPLYWLGIVGLSADGRLVSRRAAGRAVPEPCVWDGVAELIAPARADLGILLEAERYLVLHERGRLSRYHLVQAHVAAALGTGGSIGDCRRLLLKLTRAPLPETIEERMGSWEQRFGALGVRPAVVLEARSAAELDAAIADDKVRPFIRARLGGTVVEVPAAQALELAAALRDSGHLPRVDAALRLAAEPRRAYAGLVDEQVLEFLLVSLLAFQAARPAYLDELEGSGVLLERLERQFPPEKLAELRTAAARLAGELTAAPPAPRPKKKRSAARRRRL